MRITNFSLPLINLTWRLVYALHEGGYNPFDGAIRAINLTSDVESPVYCIFETNEQLFVISRGTWDCNDVSTDIEMYEISTPYGIYYKGFYSAAQYVYGIAKPFIKSTRKPIYFIGHSYGGGVSQILHTIAAQDFPLKDINTISFAPVPGADFAKNLTFGDKIVAFVNEDDVVPTLSLPNIYKRIKFCMALKYTKQMVIDLIIGMFKIFEFITHDFSEKAMKMVISCIPSVVNSLYDIHDGKKPNVYYILGTVYGISYRIPTDLNRSYIDASLSLNKLKLKISGFKDHDPNRYTLAIQNIQPF